MKSTVLDLTSQVGRRSTSIAGGCGRLGREIESGMKQRNARLLPQPDRPWLQSKKGRPLQRVPQPGRRELSARLTYRWPHRERTPPPWNASLRWSSAEAGRTKFQPSSTSVQILNLPESLCRRRSPAAQQKFEIRQIRNSRLLSSKLKSKSSKPWHCYGRMRYKIKNNKNAGMSWCCAEC